MKIKIFSVITAAYLIFWGPLFLVTLVNWDWDYAEVQQGVAHEVTLHVAFVHSFVNPALLMVLHRGIRQARSDKIPPHFLIIQSQVEMILFLRLVSTSFAVRGENLTSVENIRRGSNQQLST